MREDVPEALGFGTVVVISKAGSHERKTRIHQALEQADVAHVFMDAVMGESLTPERLAEVYDEEAALAHKTIPRRLHPSMIGCALSHREFYAQVMRGYEGPLLVLEDDAVPVPSGLPFVREALNELPDDWDLLYLGIRGNRLPPLLHPLRIALQPLLRKLFPRKYRLTRQEVARLYLRAYSEHLYRAGYHQGTHAYAVSPKGAALLHAASLPVTAPPDVLLGTMILEGKLNAFALRRNAFTTSGAASQVVSSV